jgi:hypothetical protein
MFRNNLANRLLIGSECKFSTRMMGARGKATGLSPLFEKGVDRRAANLVVSNEVLDGSTSIVIPQNPST